MLKLVAAIRRRPELSFAEFRGLWCDEHPAYVRRMPGVRRYVQNLAFEGDRREWPFDGVAELWFDDKDAVKAAFASPAGAAAREHEQTFAGESSWYLAQERTIPLEDA
jgi:uncharacterized protein (TIGR02118 family)